MTKYLALDCVKSGDIILSNEKATQSRLIRLATFSGYSHAQIAISPLIWFESADCGVQYQIISPHNNLLNPKIIWDKRKDQFRLGLEMKEGSTFLVKRVAHGINFQNGPGHRFAKELIEVTARYAFLNYARPKEFLPLLRFNLGEHRFAQLMASAFDREQSEFYPGPFCSWLVASCYQDLGHSLFDKDPRRISPGALEKSERLTDVTVFFEGDIKDLPLRFKAIERTSRLWLETSYKVMSTYSQMADITKDTTDLTSDVGRAASMLLSRQPGQPSVDEKMRGAVESLSSYFRKHQRSMEDPVIKSYIGCAHYINDFCSFNACIKACQLPDIQCDRGCSLAVERFRQLTKELQEIFPEREPSALTIDRE